MRPKPSRIWIVCFIALAGILTAQAGASADPLDHDQVSAQDGAHSADAYRLADGETGTVDSVSWKNADNRWKTGDYPMTATLDLGGLYELSSIRYYAGQIPFPGTARVSFSASTTDVVGTFSPVASGTQPSYNKWSQPLAASGQARYVQVRFNTRDEHFNLTEVEIDGVLIDEPDDPDEPDEPDDPTDLDDPHPQTSTIDSFGEAARPNTNLGTGWDAIDSYYENHPRQSGECSKELHNRYWVEGQDGKIHPTWHPTIHPSGCSFAHEHGDQPTLSPIYDDSKGVPFAMTSGLPGAGHRSEDHPGHKVVVENDFELVDGNPFNEAPIELTGVNCNWLSKIHQGSATNDALKHNAHEYLLNLDCSDGVEAHLTTMLTFGPEELVTNLCGSGTGSEAFDTGLTATMGMPVMDPLDGKREFKCLTKPGGDDGLYGAMFWKPPTTAWFQELWKADGVIKLPGNGQAINFSPYYGTRNPARYIDNEWETRGLPNAYLSTLDLCFDDNPSYRDGLAEPSFCQFVPASLDGLSSSERQRHVDNPMNGTIRAIHPKEFAVKVENVPGGEDNFIRFCTNAMGRNAEVLEAGESCAADQLEQYISRKDRWYVGWAGSSENSQVVNGQLTGSGMFEEWTRDFSDPTIRFPN